MTALHIAARDGKENMVTTLLTRCAALPDEDDRDGRTPMMLATENGHEPIVDMLLERGAKTDGGFLMDMYMHTLPLVQFSAS